MAILSKACKPDNFELHNSLKLSFTNIRGLRLNLALCETNLNDSIDCGNFTQCLISFFSMDHLHGVQQLVLLP